MPRVLAVITQQSTLFMLLPLVLMGATGIEGERKERDGGNPNQVSKTTEKSQFEKNVDATLALLNRPCLRGKWGAFCQRFCGDTCNWKGCVKHNGHCKECKWGWDPKYKCLQECPALTYGFHCKKSCVVKCGGKCNPATGKCANELDTSKVMADFPAANPVHSHLNFQFMTLTVILPMAALITIAIGLVVVYSNKRGRLDAQRQARESEMADNRLELDLGIRNSYSRPSVDQTHQPPGSTSVDDSRRQLRLGAPTQESNYALSTSAPGYKPRFA